MGLVPRRPDTGLLSGAGAASERRNFAGDARTRIGAVAWAVRDDEAVPLDQLLNLLYDSPGAEVLNNMTATIPPTVADDSAHGYSVGSIFYVPAAGLIYFAQSVTPGAAVWSLSNAPISKTVAQMQTLAGGSGFTPGQTYLITNAHGGFASIYVQAITSSTISPVAFGVFQNSVMASPSKVSVDYDLTTDKLYTVYEPLKNNTVVCSPLQGFSALNNFQFGVWEGNSLIEVELLNISTDAVMTACVLSYMSIDGNSHTGLIMYNHTQEGNTGGGELIISSNDVTLNTNTVGIGTILNLGANISSCTIGNGNTISSSTGTMDSNWIGSSNIIDIASFSMNGCFIGNGKTIELVAGQANKSWVGNESTFEAIVDIDTKLSSDIIEIPDYAGVIMLFSTVATPTCTIKSITADSNIKRKFLANNVDVTFINTSDLKFPTPTTSRVVTGNKQDFIEFKHDWMESTYLEISLNLY